MFFDRIGQRIGLCYVQRYRQSIMPYIDGELDTREEIRLENHFEKCDGCYSEYNELLFASRLVSHLALPGKSPRGIPLWSRPARQITNVSESRIPRWALIPMTAAVFVALIVLVARDFNRSKDASWEVLRLAGSPKIGSDAMGKTARLATGDWLETDSASRAMIRVGLIGQVEVDPRTILRLIRARSDENRLSLVRGKMFASITAPPRLFLVETPAGLAVDLGCAYTLEVDDAGVTLLRVHAGWVALSFGGREVAVPGGAVCRSKPGVGPGLPFFTTASEKLKAAVEEFDSRGSNAIDAILSEATERDTLTLWNLLKRVEPNDRERVYDRLQSIVPLPDGVTREGVLALDPRMLGTWAKRMEEGAIALGRKPPAQAPGSIRMTGFMETARYAHTATLLTNGKILVTGGVGVNDNRSGLSGAEIYDPAASAFTRAGDMNTRRAGHTATLLTNGRVLITGGSVIENWETGSSSAEIYDAETGRFISTGNMTMPRSGHRATLLADGRVLITGGLGTDADSPWLRSAEIYDPANGTFTATGSMNRRRADHTATLLKNGQVLITGGFSLSDKPDRATSGAEIYNPDTGRFTPTGGMMSERFKHSAVLLPDGRVLIVGGVEVVFDRQQRFYASAEVYDPARGRFSAAGSLSIPRHKITDSSVLLKNGKVLIAGGGWGVEVYDPVTGSFSALAGGMNVSRYFSTATLLVDGEVVIIGGYSAIAPEPYDLPLSNSSAWIYDPD